MRTPPLRPHGRPMRGATLAELVVTVTLVAALFAIALPFIHFQARAVTQQAGRLDAQLNARFGLSMIDRELRAAGVGVLDDQPMVVLAHPLAVTFNGDVVGQDSLFDGAVNFDPDANAGGVGGMLSTAQARLPIVGRQYPDCTYVQGGTRSRAETISFWVSRDSTSTRTDEYILFRRANALAPEVVARGIVVRPGQHVFRYFGSNAAGALAEIDSVPAVHTAVQHGNAADTARSALTDSVRVVRVMLVGRSVERRTGRQTLDTVQTSVRLANAGLLRRKTCGEAPLAGSPAFIAWRQWNNGVPEVRLAWAAMPDETGGERDIERYAIYRRRSSELGFGEPLVSVAAGQSAYVYLDTQVEPAETYVYGVAAQDCTPQNSPVVQASPVVIEAAPPS
ncbi:MAG: hypothetical protein ACXW61_11615 [Gemmatirosa sp.]